MDSTNPKVSFIPKGSLVREEFFFERSRPRSVIGFIASTVFVLVFGAYAGLYYYNDSLNQVVAEKTTEIKNAQKEFSDAPEVEDAKVFRARVDLARELLNAHTVTSPVFSFLSKNTISSILYEQFAFKNDPVVGPVLELSGEAPTYASLAYQTDILRNQKKELVYFSVQDVKLTSFGTVTFTLAMKFNHDYMLYTKNLSNAEVSVPSVQESVVPFTPSINFDIVPPSSTSTPVASTTLDLEISTSTPPSEASADFAAPLPSDTPVGGWSVPPGDATATTSVVVEKQSFLRALWSKLKFW